MSSNAGHRSYDENLLASAPVATKAQLQSGYNPDLLVEKATPPRSRLNLEAGGNGPVEQADHEPMPAKVPFYRTRKGIIIIAVVVVVVIIAAAVGGGVGGKGKKKQTAIAQPVGSTSTTTGNAQGGGVPDSTTHGTATTTLPGQTTIQSGNIPTSFHVTLPIQSSTANQQGPGQGSG